MSGQIYYDSIDSISIFNWRKCLEEQKYHFSKLDPSSGPSEKPEEDQEAWEMIYDTFLAEFSLGPDYIRYLELKLEIAELQNEFVINDDNYSRNLINRLMVELEELRDRPVESDMDTSITYLSKWLGFRINQKKTTIREFYKYSRDYQKEIELQKRSNGKG